MSDIIEENSKNLQQNIEEHNDEPKELCSCSVRLNGALQEKLSAKLRKGMLASLIVGIVFILAFLVLSMLNGELLGGSEFVIDDSLLWLVLIVGAFLFAFGLVIPYTIKKNVKNVDALNQENMYRFYPSYVVIRTIRAGETLGEMKQYYSDFVKVQEKKEFFLLYPNSATVFPIPKSELSAEQIEMLRGVLPLKR